MFFSPFFSGRPFRPLGIFVSAYIFFFSISRNPSIRFALTHPCATGQYRLVLYTAICSALVRFFFFFYVYFITQREYEKTLEKTFNESATSIMTMCSTAAAIVGATSGLAGISVEGLGAPRVGAPSQKRYLRY